MKLSKILLLVAIVSVIAFTGCDNFSLVGILDGYVLTVENQTAYSLEVTVDGINGSSFVLPGYSVDVKVFQGDNIVTATEATIGDIVYVLNREFYSDYTWTITVDTPVAKMALIPTFYMSTDNFQARSVTSQTQDEYIDDILIYGPVTKGFEAELVAVDATEVLIDMPGNEIADRNFTFNANENAHENASFAYSSPAEGIDILVLTSPSNIEETVEMPFSTANGDFVIYKHTVFDANVADETFSTTWSAYGYLYHVNDEFGGSVNTMLAAAKMSGQIAKTADEFGILIESTTYYTGIVGLPASPSSWDLADFAFYDAGDFTSGGDTLPRLYHYDLNTQEYSLIDNDTTNDIDSYWPL